MTEDDQKFIDAIRAAVKERGADWMYPEPEMDPEDSWGEKSFVDDWHSTAYGTCVYSKPDGSPACIIGLVLSKIDSSMVPSYDYSLSARAVLKGIDLELSPEIIDAARAAQSAQDAGHPWGKALEAFEEVLRKAGGSDDD